MISSLSDFSLVIGCHYSERKRTSLKPSDFFVSCVLACRLAIARATNEIIKITGRRCIKYTPSNLTQVIAAEHTRRQGSAQELVALSLENSADE
jgi:hypothetical protein